MSDWKKLVDTVGERIEKAAMGDDVNELYTLAALLARLSDSAFAKAQAGDALHEGNTSLANKYEDKFNSKMEEARKLAEIGLLI